MSTTTSDPDETPAAAAATEDEVPPEEESTATFQPVVRILSSHTTVGCFCSSLITIVKPQVHLDEVETETGEEEEVSMVLFVSGIVFGSSIYQ